MPQTFIGSLIACQVFWGLNWKGTCLLVQSSLQSAHKNLEGSRGVVSPFKSDIFRVNALVKGDRKPNLEGD